MSWAFAGAAVAGWALAACLLAVLRRRLALVADAEHELRGAAAAIGLAAERMKRAGATRAFASLLDVQLDRAKAGLADLERARRRPSRRTAGATTPPTDSARLAQVVTNLVTNAAQHGTGPVEISWRPTRSGARLEIRNPNRPPELDDLLAPRGRGLGIAARAARDLGASLRVDTGARDTSATLELPAAAGRDPVDDRARLAA